MNKNAEAFLRDARAKLAIAALCERYAAQVNRFPVIAINARATLLEFADACGAVAANKMALAIRIDKREQAAEPLRLVK